MFYKIFYNKTELKKKNLYNILYSNIIKKTKTCWSIFFTECMMTRRSYITLKYYLYYIYNTKAYCIFFLQTKSTAYLQAPAAKYAAFKVCSLINISPLY